MLSWAIHKRSRKNTTFQVNDFIVGGGTLHHWLVVQMATVKHLQPMNIFKTFAER
jgi:hypothetical protein